MTKVTCPVCKSSVDCDRVQGEMLPAELDDLGIPYACSVSEAFGLPIVQPGSWAVELNGVPVKNCVAFDRYAGAVWHYPEGPDGKLIMLGEQIYVEKLEGVVTVQPLKGFD